MDGGAGVIAILGGCFSQCTKLLSRAVDLVLSCGRTCRPKYPVWGPPEKFAPSPVLSCLSKRRTHPLPHCPPATPQKDQKSTRNVNPFSCRHLWTTSLWWINYRQQVNVWPGQHTGKPCARPSLPPYLLYKVSKSYYYTFFSFHCHFASPLHCKKC